jgi:glycosyltransferase involved in cell wall biosynthesis
VREHAARADRILVPSAYTRDAVIRQLGIAPDRIALCPPGAPAWAPRTTTPVDGYLLFVGTLEPRKNVGALLDAYECLLSRHTPSAPRLLLAGRARPDEPETEQWLRRLQSPPLVGHVTHRGYFAPEEREALYRGAAALVAPSLDEGFGLPVLEAMTIGVPVIAANRGALPEVLGGTGLLVDPLDREALAQAMERIVADDQFAESCAARGIRRSTEFRWCQTAARVYDTYVDAIGAHAGRGSHGSPGSPPSRAD